MSKKWKQYEPSKGGPAVRNLIAMLVCCAMLFVMGCSSLTVNYDYDKEADFSSYKTYAWVAQQAAAAGNARAAQASDQLFIKRLKTAGNSQLEAKGYKIDVEDPDFVIAYHIGVENKTQVTDWGYSYGPGYGMGYGGGWGGGSNIDVSTYEEGTLILDFYDYSTKQLVWRGTATKALSSNPDPEKAEAKVNEIVAKMLENFPPPQK